MKSPAPKPVTERLKELRERADIPMDKFAKSVGFKGASSYQRYEDPTKFTNKYLPLEKAEKFAKALVGRGEPPITKDEVMALAGAPYEISMPTRTVKVVGYVGAGAAIYPLDDDELDEVLCPMIGMGPDAVAVRVRGSSMEDAHMAGDLLFYDEITKDFEHLIGKECVVALDDGRRLVKVLKRTRDGKTYLHSLNSEPIFGVNINWVAKVKLVKPS